MTPKLAGFQNHTDFSLMLRVHHGSAVALLSADLSPVLEQPLSTSLFLFRAGEKENKVTVHASSSCFLLEVTHGHWSWPGVSHVAILEFSWVAVCKSCLGRGRKFW